MYYIIHIYVIYYNFSIVYRLKDEPHKLCCIDPLKLLRYVVYILSPHEIGISTM